MKTTLAVCADPGHFVPSHWCTNHPFSARYKQIILILFETHFFCFEPSIKSSSLRRFFNNKKTYCFVAGMDHWQFIDPKFISEFQLCFFKSIFFSSKCGFETNWLSMQCSGPYSHRVLDDIYAYTENFDGSCWHLRNSCYHSMSPFEQRTQQRTILFKPKAGDEQKEVFTDWKKR